MILIHLNKACPFFYFTRVFSSGGAVDVLYVYASLLRDSLLSWGITTSGLWYPSYTFGCWDFLFHLYLLYFVSFHSSFLTFFLSFFVLFYFFCSHALVFGKTLLHEFHISYSCTEWYLFFPTVELQVYYVYSEQNSKNT